MCGAHPLAAGIAFDADAQTNPNVANARDACVDACLQLGIEVELEQWELTDGKGIDDVLLAGIEPSRERLQHKRTHAADHGVRQSQSTQLIKLAEQNFGLHISAYGDAFVIPRSGPQVTRMFRGRHSSLRRELAAAYAEEHERVPSGSALTDALSVLEGRATRAEPVRLWQRVARHGEDIIVDLGDASGRAVLIRDQSA